MAAPPAVGDSDRLVPGTRQLTAIAATVTSSQRHLGATRSKANPFAVPLSVTLQ